MLSPDSRLSYYSSYRRRQQRPTTQLEMIGVSRFPITSELRSYSRGTTLVTGLRRVGSRIRGRGKVAAMTIATIRRSRRKAQGTRARGTRGRSMPTRARGSPAIRRARRRVRCSRGRGLGCTTLTLRRRVVLSIIGNSPDRGPGRTTKGEMSMAVGVLGFRSEEGGTFLGS